MAATLSGISLSTPGFLAKAIEAPTVKSPWLKLSQPWKKSTQFSAGRMILRPVAAKPADLSDKVAESIKEAEEACAGDPVSGECVAAWDEVEELSAAASHAKDKKKDSDPLEEYCKENPETQECRTYDD
ncbi:hypothetical protein DCAR_0206478 [Daucus carota subsp. sativus]|uniref:CP12 domain-containing protein n=1 Tax=Daucus carota subsp. sativus TaxID=79200 RepID=A0A169WPZ9_DAUCS|nr:PREDICTED: calvin cycle protein CP12-2, chloroplastic-like [Daucus carota subsp. sativus]WOG87255.1 hypothetical protein DCAR_0206478 [Daucus carota subsp. sativus]